VGFQIAIVAQYVSSGFPVVYRQTTLWNLQGSLERPWPKAIQPRRRQKTNADPIALMRVFSCSSRTDALGIGAKSGIRLADVKVPGCLPDSEIVRSAVADYLWEVQRFDREVGAIRARLDAIGELENTIRIWPDCSRSCGACVGRNKQETPQTPDTQEFVKSAMCANGGRQTPTYCMRSTGAVLGCLRAHHASWTQFTAFRHHRTFPRRAGR